MRNSENQIIHDPKAMANILSNQYSSVFSQPRHVLEELTQPSNPSIENLDFNAEDLVKTISKLSSKSACGPDDFRCKHSLSVPLTIFWKKCIET